MEIVPWVIIALNVLGAIIMVKWGLPQEVPFLGRADADPIVGYLGLMFFVTSIAARILLIVTS